MMGSQLSLLLSAGSQLSVTGIANVFVVIIRDRLMGGGLGCFAYFVFLSKNYK